ncbi:hypothetical protein HZB93_02810 [Candidatus Falkowbacteria bacterium]|nr:hypothetical protein [Candidatus Falkowbacteria bacterium]
MAGTKEKKKKVARGRAVRKAEVSGKDEVKMLKAAEEMVELPPKEEEKMLSGKKPAGAPPRKEKRLGKKEIDKELREIYEDQDGKISDMSKIYHKKKNRVKRFMVGALIFCIFAAALSWAGFFFFGRGRAFSGEKVNLEITSPDTVAGGEKVEYTIKYENNETVPLGQAEINIRLPENFVLSETDPVIAEGQSVWKIGSIAASKSGEIKIRGILYGEQESLATLQAVLTYKPADFNSEFQKVATAVTKIQSSFLDVALSGPERILANKEINFKIKYKNVGSEPLQGIKISVIGPEDFSFKERPGVRDAASWEIAEAAPGEEKEIEFAGSFGPAAEGEREFKAQIGFANGDKFYLQKENIFKTNVLVGAIMPTLILNGDPKDRTVSFGSTLNYAVVYQNKDKTDLSDVEIKMIFESTSRNNKMILDWATLKDDANGVVLGTQLTPEVRQGTITWTKRQIPALAKLAPGAEGTINFQIKVKPFLEFQSWNTKDFNVKSFVSVKIGKNGNGTEEETIESNTINLKINSDLALTAEARYFNDDNIAVGSGPLPPKVGEVTAYRIFWGVTNSLHEVENLKVSATLPGNINWSGKYEIAAGELKFDEATREVTWTLNRMPLDVKSLGADFEITVTPAAGEKGKLLTLILDTNLQATDKTTSGTITINRDALTSNLDGDPAAEGKGIVR